MRSAIKLGLSLGLLMITILLVLTPVVDNHYKRNGSRSDDKHAFRDTLLAPIGSARVLALYNESFVEESHNHHKGIDLDGAKGMPIRAAAEGFVTFNQQLDRGNWTIEITHTSVKGARTTEYVGPFSSKVRVGDPVGRGQTIAVSSIDEKPQVHFAVYDHDNRRMDPCRFITACRNITIPDELTPPPAHANGWRYGSGTRTTVSTTKQ